jgi:kynurenine formamidase
MESQKEVPAVEDLLADCPSNWGRWGADDEVGALNFLDAGEVLRGVQEVRSGKSFTLQVQINHPHGDPAFPGPRGPAKRVNIMDRGYFLSGKGTEFPGGTQFADDMIVMYLQGSTQYDALGHVWCGGQLYNGYDAATTTGGLDKASVLPIAERGIAGRGILLDVARYRGKPWLDKGETFSHEDLEQVARAQGVTIAPHDILLIRTGFLEYFYASALEEFYEDFNEPGLAYSKELVEWFRQKEIPNLATDTIANEVTIDPASGVALPLHIALMRNLGVTFCEIVGMDVLAQDCAKDGQYSFLYVAAPLKITGATGSPVNPIVIK